MDVRGKTVTGMAKYIDREALVEWLKRIPRIFSDGGVSKDAWQERKPDDFCSYGERKEGTD